MVRLTVLTNVFNEEYLLPFWLEHHRKIFDHGIVFDWACTDRSMDIVREMCPTWEIRKSPHEKFDAFANDILLMITEKEIEGYKMVLNTTEFLVSSEPIRTLIADSPDSYYPLYSLVALSTKDVQEPTTLRELFDGIERIEQEVRMFRILHSYDHGHYSLGRHERTLPPTAWISAMVIWFAEYPWNAKILERGMQITSKIPDSDYERGISFHHRYTAEQRAEVRLRHLETSVPITDLPYITEALL
jgi:hypothetical protein